MAEILTYRIDNMAKKTIKCLVFLIIYLQCSLCSPEESILGHMLPLGSHQKPENVEERFDIPSAKDFFENYVLPSKAVVLRGILKDSPMLHNWTDEYLLEKYPDFELRLEAKTEKEGYVPMGDVSLGRDSLKNFIDTYHQTNKYVVSELPTPAWDDFLVPPSLTCGPIKQNMVEIDLWMSGGSTSSLLHKDAFNTLNCLVNGTKEWKLFEYKYEGSLYKAYEAGDPKGGFSRINPEAVDLKKYPKVATVPWSFTTVHKGDCLFLPKSMYHQVKSFGTMNTAVAILFSRFDKPSERKASYNDCPSDFLPLSKIDVDWQYPGKGAMSMGYPELSEIRDSLAQMVGGSSKKLYQRIVQAVDLKDFHPLNATEKARQLLVLLSDGDSNKKIDKKLIKQLPRSLLRKAAFLVEPLIPSNTYEYEFFHISPREIAELLSILVKKGEGIVQRKNFIEQYQERLWGSSKIAGLLFDDLAGKEAEKVAKEDIVKNFYIAAKKFDKEERSEQTGDESDEKDEDRNEEDDAYIGRNVNLADRKDVNTLKDLGKQILEGDFVDTEFNPNAIRENDEAEDEEDREDEKEDDVEETGSPKGGDRDSEQKKDEL